MLALSQEAVNGFSFCQNDHMKQSFRLYPICRKNMITLSFINMFKHDKTVRFAAN